MSEEPSPTPFTSATEDLLLKLEALEIPPLAMHSASPTTPLPARRANSSSTQMERHPEFWFFDGSIVLVAERTMFRVHKAFLARHSVFFRDMFSLPQPQEDPSSSTKPSNVRPVSGDGASIGDGGEMEEVEGCSTLRLHDSPDDVASLLYALYDGPYVDLISPIEF